MPDVREVYDMVTKQRPSDPGALERQRTRQIRAMRNRKVGALALAAGMAALAVVVFAATRTEVPSGTVGASPRPTPEEIATSFMDAYGAFDADRAIGYMADYADVSMMVSSIGEVIEGPDEEPSMMDGLRLSIAHLAAVGYEQHGVSCDESSTAAFGTVVRCSFDLHLLRSSDLGLGPFGPATITLTIRDGKIVRASGPDFDYEKEFSAQVWEPFSDWVYSKHPKDAEVMYAIEGTYTALSEESNRLWGLNLGRYVDAVRAGEAD